MVAADAPYARPRCPFEARAAVRWQAKAGFALPRRAACYPRPGALRVHAPAGVVPPQPSEHPQHRRVSGDVSAGSRLNTRDRAGARRLGRYLIVLELHAGMVIGFETLRHAGRVSRFDGHCHRWTTALRQQQCRAAAGAIASRRGWVSSGGFKPRSCVNDGAPTGSGRLKRPV
jgi:hypothetical protein